MNHEYASLTLKELIEIAMEAGIYEGFYPGFGTLLGIVRENDFIGHDGDMDVIIDCDKTTLENRKRYKDLLREHHMYKHRWRCQKRVDNGDLLWVSIQKYDEGPKCCNWFSWRENGFFLHSKGKKWVLDRKFKKDKYGYTSEHQAICKGIPEGPFNELIDLPQSVSEKFYNIQCKIPKRYGEILDAWYPDWRVPRKGGSSKAKIVMTVKDWSDSKTHVIHKY